jgi:hypothetical protein
MEEEREHCDDDVENFQVILFFLCFLSIFRLPFFRHTDHTKENEIINDDIFHLCFCLCCVLCPGSTKTGTTRSLVGTGRHHFSF